MKIKKDFSLRNKNTFGLDVKADHYVSVQNEKDLKEAVQWAKRNEMPVFILGGGSNVLLTDDVKGLTISVDISEISVKDISKEKVLLSAGAGVNWHELVLFSIEQNLGGLENLSLIPGSVGASPIQNIGAYGVELKDVFHELRAFSIDKETIQTFSPEQCQFGYRDSFFKSEGKGKFIITYVNFLLSREHKVNTSYGVLQKTLEEMGISSPTIEDVSKAVISIRQSKLPDPSKTGNAGSFFKNPEILPQEFEAIQKKYPEIPSYPLDNGNIKIPAAWLIEKCGWKGKQVGNVATHHRQPLVVINKGGAEGREVVEFSKQIQKEVKEKFGIELQPEVNII